MLGTLIFWASNVLGKVVLCVSEVYEIDSGIIYFGQVYFSLIFVIKFKALIDVIFLKIVFKFLVPLFMRAHSINR